MPLRTVFFCLLFSLSLSVTAQSGVESCLKFTDLTDDVEDLTLRIEDYSVWIDAVMAPDDWGEGDKDKPEEAREIALQSLRKQWALLHDSIADYEKKWLGLQRSVAPDCMGKAVFASSNRYLARARKKAMAGSEVAQRDFQNMSKKKRTKSLFKHYDDWEKCIELLTEFTMRGIMMDIKCDECFEEKL